MSFPHGAEKERGRARWESAWMGEGRHGRGLSRFCRAAAGLLDSDADTYNIYLQTIIEAFSNPRPHTSSQAWAMLGLLLETAYQCSAPTREWRHGGGSFEWAQLNHSAVNES